MSWLKHIKKYFIPGKHNQYKPHFFRLEAVLATGGVIVFLFAVAAALNTLVIRSGSFQLSAVVASTLVELTNADREKNHLHELSVNPVLQKIAQMKADDMARLSYFAHNSPEGMTPWHWFEEAGYDFSFAGENLAVYFSDSAELEHAWMESPLHRANILNSYFTEIGVATAKGMYQGRETVYVAQVFGRPGKHTPQSSSENMSESAPKDDAPAVKGATAGIEPLEIFENNDTFIAVRKKGEHIGVEEKQNITEKASFAGTSVPAILKIAASPKTFLQTTYLIIALFILGALGLMIGVEIKRQHPLHIAYGVSLLAFMGTLVFFWQGFFFGKLLVL